MDSSDIEVARPVAWLRAARVLEVLLQGPVVLLPGPAARGSPARRVRAAFVHALPELSRARLR